MSTHEQDAWDARYAEATRIWSGEPNGALVAEVADLPPGRALDVGCGEGADAVWLAQQGWAVTALDVSGVALARARAHANEAGVTVTFHHGGLVDAVLQPFDLVSAHYPALPTSPEHAGERALLGLVAPGGTLLIVHHQLTHDEGHQHGFDPAEYVMPADVRAHLDEGWEVIVDEVRARNVHGGGGAHHVEDVILRARRNLRA